MKGIETAGSAGYDARMAEARTVAVVTDDGVFPSSEALAERLLIIGNSGSGKSTLSERIARRTSQPVLDLDLVHWHEDGQKRDEDVARDRVRANAVEPSWIIEGVYGWLAEIAVVRATALIWVDSPWSECRDGLLRRGLRRGMTRSDQDALLAWAENYWSRSTPSSAAGHERLFTAFDRPKVRLLTRRDTDALVVRFEADMSKSPATLT